MVEELKPMNRTLKLTKHKLAVQIYSSDRKYLSAYHTKHYILGTRDRAQNKVSASMELYLRL